jgi:hypothetical protein
MAVGVSACAGVDESDGPLGAAQQAQIDPGLKDYVIYGLTNSTGTSLGNVLVTATAGDGYSANVEYWYLTSNLSNSAAVTFTGGTAEYWSTAPSGLGTLSFTTERTPTWTSGTMSGSMLQYSNAFTGELDAIDWGMSESGGTWSGSITWWHNSTGNLFGAGTSRTLSPTSTSGTAYYYTTSPL